MKPHLGTDTRVTSHAMEKVRSKPRADSTYITVRTMVDMCVWIALPNTTSSTRVFTKERITICAFVTRVGLYCPAGHAPCVMASEVNSMGELNGFVVTPNARVQLLTT